MPASPIDPSRPAAEPTGGLLDRVLEQTFRRLRAQGGLEDADAAALVDVARRRRGEPFSLDPVGSDLVRAVLTDALAPSVTPPPHFDALVAQVTQTLGEDVTSRARLERLWLELNEVQA